jgi:hypothetical protein
MAFSPLASLGKIISKIAYFSITKVNRPYFKDLSLPLTAVPI